MVDLLETQFGKFYSEAFVIEQKERAYNEGIAKGLRIEVHSVLPTPENFNELRDELVNAIREKLKAMKPP